MKQFLALLLACTLTLCACTAVASEEYTVAEKLYKQLWAGSGFSGVLTAEVSSPGLNTQEPLSLDVDYIYVRPTDEIPAEHRLDVSAQDKAAHAQLTQNRLSFQADVIGPEWYAVAVNEELSALAESLLSHTGAPSLAQTVVMGASALQNSTALKNALEPYLVRMDIWLESCRQDAVLSKMDEDTTAMEVNYVISPAAIKAQVKQLIVDVLSDNIVLPLLSDALGEDAAAFYLNPDLQSWYFSAVDALPFPGDLTLSRTVSLEGDVLATHLSLPLYDEQAGAITLSYDRTRSQGDLPDENAIRLESEKHSISLLYQEYSSMTGVNVMRGTLESAEAGAEKPFAAAFTLRQEHQETADADGFETAQHSLALTLEPVNEGGFEPVEANLSASFASAQLKSAATDVQASLTVEVGETTVKLGFEGASRKKWEPEPISAEPILLKEADTADWLEKVIGQ